MAVDAAAALYEQLEQLQDEPEQALVVIDQLLELNPSDPDAVAARCVCLVHAGQFNEAIGFIDSSGAPMQFEKAYCLYKCKRYDECLELVQRREHIELEQFQQLRAQILYRTTQYDEAAPVFEQLHRADGEQDPSELCANYIASRAHGTSPSVSVQEIAAEAGSEPIFDVVYNVACLFLSCGMFAEATEHLQTAIGLAEETLVNEGCTVAEVADECAAMRVQLGYVLQKQRRYDEAMSVYQEVLKAKPTDTHVLTVAQNNVVSLKKDSDLFDSFKKIKAAMEPSVLEDKLTEQQRRVIQMNHALLLLYMNKLDACRDQLTKLEAKFGVDESTCLLKSALLHREKKFAKAEETLAEYATTHGSQRVELTIAELQLARGCLPEAIKTLSAISSLDGRIGMVSTLVSLHEQSPDGMASASEVLENAASNNPQKELLWQRACFYERHHDYQKAAAAYEQLIALDNHDVKAVAGLVTACAQFEPGRAEQYAERIPALEAADSIDAEALEAQMVEQVPRDRRVKRQGGAVEDAALAAANDAAKQMELRRKEAKRQKRLRTLNKRLPKNLDPAKPESWPSIDKERWLPKRDRSYYRPRRGYRKNQTRSGGTQGAGYSALNEQKYDYSEKVPPQSLSHNPLLELRCSGC